jgi:ABC-type lipoprotein release transport system permease subunit
MFAVAVLVAHKLRAGWRSWAALAVLTAVAGGVVLTATAGALRTDSAYPRFLSQSSASDVLVSPALTGLTGYYSALTRLRGAAITAPLVGIQAVPVSAGGTVGSDATTFAALDSRYGHEVDRPKLLAGRLPGQNSPAEVALTQIAAGNLHLRVGSVLRLAAFSSGTPPRFRLLTEHVVGIFVGRGSVVPVTELDRGSMIMASLALYRELGPGYQAYDGAYVKLRPGEPLSVYSAAAEALARRFPATGGQVFVADESAQAATIERSIRPQAVALGLFALAVALCAWLIVGQVATRTLLAAARDNGTLAALGMTRRQLIAAGLAEVTAASAAGAAGACVIAVAASPLMPIGPARLAEPDPGVAVNVPVLAVGFTAITALLLVRVAVTAWRQAPAHPAASVGQESSRHPAKTAERLARAGAPLAAVTGIRFALDPGSGRAAVPVRSALLGLAVAVAAVAGAATFGANLLRLVDTPRLYGQDWDAAIELQFGGISPRQFDQLTAHVPGIASWTFGVHGTIGIGATVIPAIGLAPGRGPLMSSTVLDGRPPGSNGEIVLGSLVLRQLGLRVGQDVPVAAGGSPHVERVVGSAVFPFFGQGSFTPTDLGEGAETTASLLAKQAGANGNGPTGYNFVLIRFAPGPRARADIAAFDRAMARYCAAVQQGTCVVTDQRPNTVTNYANIDATPAVLAAILAVLGLAVLAQFTMASARRRRRDFAVLKVLGMVRSQLGAVTCWQVSTVTAVALLAGLPLGIAGGRWAWQLFASQAGLGTGAVTPPSLFLMIPVTAGAAILVALPAARSCARLRAAATLRSE